MTRNIDSCRRALAIAVRAYERANEEEPGMYTEDDFPEIEDARNELALCKNDCAD